MKHETHIVALSGGKDSTAMALRLSEIEPRDYVYICTPTGDELPEMEDHWDLLSKILGQPIIRLHDPQYPSIYDLIDHFQMLPNWRARWCTRILKIETAQMFYDLVKPAIIYVGLRADEERDGNKLYDANIEQRFPMQEWGWKLSDVVFYLGRMGIKIPRRTDCAMCFYQRIGEWWNLWKDYPEIFKNISDIEDRIGHTLASPGKWGSNWPHKLSELEREFERGRVPRNADDHFPLFGEHESCRACSL